MKTLMGLAFLILGVVSAPVSTWGSDSHTKQTKHAEASGEGDEHGDHADDHEAEHSEEHEDEHGHEEGEDGENSRFGTGKAILAANKKEGIQLSEKAVATLGLKRQALSGNAGFTLPKKSAVYSKEEVGVFRWRDGWFKLVDVTLERKGASDITVRSKDLRAGDQVVIEGTALLRAAELEAWGGSGDGHGH